MLPAYLFEAGNFMYYLNVSNAPLNRLFSMATVFTQNNSFA